MTRDSLLVEDAQTQTGEAFGKSLFSNLNGRSPKERSQQAKKMEPDKDEREAGNKNGIPCSSSTGSEPSAWKESRASQG